MDSPVLHLLGCATPPVQYVHRPIRAAQARGWDVCLGLTPTARDWLDDRLPDLAHLTGHPVRSHYRKPGEADDWPRPDVLAVAPASLNTVNTWALGLTPNYVAGAAAEAMGKRLPLVAMPCVNSTFATHPQFGRSLATLREAGVRVLYGEPDGFVPEPPGQAVPEAYPWNLLLDAVEAVRRG